MKMSSLQYNFLAKILLLGEFRVGKSSMVLRYVEDRFPGDYMATIGANFLVKTVMLEIGGKVYKTGLQIWDIGGHARSSQVGRVFFQGVSGALLVYDLTRHSTFKNIESKWYHDYAKFTDSKSKGNFLLIGNKIDLNESRIISKEEGEHLASKLKATEFIETSAKHGDNVEKTPPSKLPRVKLACSVLPTLLKSL